MTGRGSSLHSIIVSDFFDWILHQKYPNKNVYVILDEWSAHKSNFICAYADLHPHLHLAYLPRCSSWINSIERDFSRIQKEFLDNSNFDKPSDAKNVITMFIEKEINSSEQCS